MNYLDIFKNGSGIHIKKKNRGKFTDYCGGHVTEECIQRGKHSSNPTTRKRATFAANARKWKHEEGGIISAKNGMDTSRVYYDSEEIKTTPTLKQTLLERVNQWNTTKPERTSKEEVEDTGWDDLFTEESPTAVQETKKDISDDLKTLLTMFDNAGIKVRMTSGYREGAKTKQGNQSHHSTGNAMDIVPENGDFAALANAIRSNPDISTFMKSKGLGVLDETTTEMLSKTGGTGAHFHIGPDNIAQNFWKV